VTGSVEKDLSERGYKMKMFVPSKDAQMELWNGSRTGPQGAVDISGADEVIEVVQRGLCVCAKAFFEQATDISHLTSHLRALLSSNGAGSIYIDVPATPFSGRAGSSSRSRTAQTIINFLSPSSTPLPPFDIFSGNTRYKGDYDAVLAILTGYKPCPRPLASLKAEVEKLRVIKSENEARVMHQAAEISSKGHSQVGHRSTSVYQRLPCY
jgi:intermediate cleaving peptidase 55